MINKISNRQTINNIFKNRVYCGVLVSILTSIVLLGWFIMKIILPSFYDEMMINIVDEAKRVGTHISRYNDSKYDMKKIEHVVNELKKDFHIEKIKVFDANGVIRYSTEAKDIGNKNKHEYFYNIVAKGEVFYKIAPKGNKTLEGRVVPKDVAEIYIPQMKDNIFVGASEIYYDITQKRESLSKLVLKIKKVYYLFSTIFTIFTFVLIYIISRQDIASKMMLNSINQKSKMAAMGEMIRNIAHQWRQPLSSISVSASAIKLQKDLGMIDLEKLDKYTSKIVQSTKYLSNTIDDFKNFFEIEKVEKATTTKELIDSTYSIIWANLKNENIEFIQNIKDIEFTTLENELKQVILNIINNAKDAFVINEVEDRFIFVDIDIDNLDQIQINIKDNAGGIPANIIDKIFEPYFTTKHKSQGTGIGLYMSLEIIQKHLNGSLTVSNETYTYNDQKYTGAKFTITLEK